MGRTRTSRATRRVAGGTRGCAVLVLAMTACGDCDEGPADLREFHGNPSSIVCGQRWSHDHESFGCYDQDFALRALARFGRLRSVSISDSTVNVSGAWPLPLVTDLSLNRATIAGEAIPLVFPALESIGASGEEFDVSSLPPMPRLRRINVGRTVPPNAEAIARHPALRVVILSYLLCDRCEARIAASIRALRPDIEVETTP